MTVQYNDITKFFKEDYPTQTKAITLNTNFKETPIVSVDSVYLYTTRKSQCWNTVNYRFKKLDGYFCNRNIINGNVCEYLIRREAYQKNFLKLRLVKGETGISSNYIRIYVDLHLNSFLYQCFNEETIDTELVIDNLNSLIRHYTNLKLFDINRLKISSVDIACDVKLNHSPDHYLNLIHNIYFSRYYLLKNQTNNTLSLHSNKDLADIETEKDTKRLAVIYNKTKQYNDVHGIELPRNILRLEYKFNSKKKNKIDSIGPDNAGIKKFSDIFQAKLAKALQIELLPPWLLKYESTDIDNVRKSKRASTFQKYLTRFANQDQYRQEYLALRENKLTKQSEKSKLNRDFQNYKECHFIKLSIEVFGSSNKFELYKELCIKLNRLDLEHVNFKTQNTYKILQNLIDYPH